MNHDFRKSARQVANVLLGVSAWILRGAAWACARLSVTAERLRSDPYRSDQVRR